MMKISAVQIATASLAVLLLAPALAAQSGEQAAASPAVSKVRIVRLSQVKGEVQFDPGAGRGFEPAMANLPVVENNRLQTGDGVAEVEFEDNSSLRLGPNSEVEFPTLERMANGGTLSSVRVLKGMAYVSLMKTPNNQFNLLFGQQNLELPPSSHVRLQLEGNEAKLAVLGGDLEIKSPSGLLNVPHKRTITFAMASSSEPTVAKDVAADPFDAWDHSEADYHDQVATRGFQQHAVQLRAERYVVLRRLRRHWRLRDDVASLLCERRLEPIFERRVGMVRRRHGVFVGVSLSLGMDSVPFRVVVLLPGCGLGLDARRRRLDGD